jgi:beta-N-acetylhexosaminidase
MAILLVAGAVVVTTLTLSRSEHPAAPESASAAESTTTSAGTSARTDTTASADPSASTDTTASTGPSASTGTGSPLTPLQRAGQRIIYSYRGLNPPASLLQHIRTGEAAGVIFFAENVSSTTQIASVIQQLRQAQRQSPVHAPLLLMTDQEGGKIRRLPGEPLLSAKQIGQSANPPAQAAAAGRDAAGALGAVGMNVNLAPVLDVSYAAGNFIDQLQRSYSSHANTVAALGSNFITAQQAAGVAATAKHFPGLGSAALGQNTDTGPVTVTVGLSGLRGRDEVPYSAAIAAGVKLVMLSWAVYPALDPALPAGLSPTVVQSELRTRLHYTGVTITDTLEADALQAYGTTARRAVLAAQAGMDLILCTARDDTQESAAAGLANALADGQLDPASFTAALDRVNALRAGLR